MGKNHRGFIIFQKMDEEMEEMGMSVQALNELLGDFKDAPPIDKEEPPKKKTAPRKRPSPTGTGSETTTTTTTTSSGSVEELQWIKLSHLMQDLRALVSEPGSVFAELNITITPKHYKLIIN